MKDCDATVDEAMTPLLLFRAGLPEPLALTSEEERSLEEVLSQVWESAISHTNAFGLTQEDFLPYLASKLGVLDTQNLFEEIESQSIELLVAAKSAAHGHPQAIAWIEQHSFSVVGPALAKIGATPFVDEVLQHIRQALFISSENTSEGRIAEMAGKGELRGLVRIMAVRAGLNCKRGETRAASRANADLATHFCGQEIKAVGLDASAREQEKVLFKTAFQKALEGLDGEARSVLRMHILHRMNISQIADIFDVHRATTARWIATIRSDLNTQTRAILSQSLQLDERELDSLLQVAQSRIDISFERILEQ